MFQLFCTFLFLHMAITHGGVVKQETVTVCKQRPIELGIVLDSSSSISYKDFQKSIDFLQDFVSQYDIGDGRNDVRVSLITFGKGIYRQDAFDLTSYSTKDALMEAIAQVPHRVGLYTSTGEAIEYMSQTQLSMDVSRPWAKRISIVITDGNSQLWRQTRDASQAARDSGIDIYAVGVGRVRREELLRIAGDEKNVLKVDSYDQLKEIKEMLAYKTCTEVEKTTTTTTTTTPPPQTQKCGEENPADIYFVFSPAELGLESTSWTTSFVSTTVKQEEMDEGFRFGVVSGSCPDDEGFDLDDYTSAEEIDNRLTSYLRPRMSGLVKRLSTSGYSQVSGGRSEARDVAVLVAKSGKRNKGLEAEVRLLQEKGVQVFIVDPTGSSISIEGATTLTGLTAKEASTNLVSHLCPVRTGQA